MEKASCLTNKKAWLLNGLSRAAALALIVVLALISGGCLVGNEEFDKARLERDEYRGQLVRLHESNDSLKREISEIYESCGLIGSQLTVMAAMNIHDRYTANLGRPILPPPIPAAAAATTSTSTSRPARTQPREVRREQPSSQQPSAAGRSGSGSRSSASGGSRSGSGGGTRPAPAPTPPASSGGGGSIDWGF